MGTRTLLTSNSFYLLTYYIYYAHALNAHEDLPYKY